MRYRSPTDEEVIDPNFNPRDFIDYDEDDYWGTDTNYIPAVYRPLEQSEIDPDSPITKSFVERIRDNPDAYMYVGPKEYDPDEIRIKQAEKEEEDGNQYAQYANNE